MERTRNRRNKHRCRLTASTPQCQERPERLVPQERLYVCGPCRRVGRSAGHHRP